MTLRKTYNFPAHLRKNKHPKDYTHSQIKKKNTLPVTIFTHTSGINDLFLTLKAISFSDILDK